jgi:hypothetical protein
MGNIYLYFLVYFPVHNNIFPPTTVGCGKYTGKYKTRKYSIPSLYFLTTILPFSTRVEINGRIEEIERPPKGWGNGYRYSRNGLTIIFQFPTLYSNFQSWSVGNERNIISHFYQSQHRERCVQDWGISILYGLRPMTEYTTRVANPHLTQHCVLAAGWVGPQPLGGLYPCCTGFCGPCPFQE